MQEQEARKRAQREQELQDELCAQQQQRAMEQPPPPPPASDSDGDVMIVCTPPTQALAARTVAERHGGGSDAEATEGAGSKRARPSSMHKPVECGLSHSSLRAVLCYGRSICAELSVM